MFDKKTCERCGKQYRLKTVSENRGKHYCSDCMKLCLKCGKKLPMSHWFGTTCSVTTAFTGTIRDAQSEFVSKPWIGSGLCNECYWEQDRLLKEAQLRQAQEVLETPTIWTCEYCQTVNRGNFCSNCAASRKKVK